VNSGVALLVILGLVASLQYWRGRRLNLTLIRELSRQMEEALQPVNKNYTWIGGYVGVVSEYDLKHEVYEKVKGTISLLPHHSLLYFPISLLLGRRDRVYILVYPKRKLKGKAHIAIGKIKDISNVSFKDEIELKGVVVQRRYDSKEEAEFMTKIISRLKDPSSLEHLAANVEENAYYARLRIGRGDISELLRRFIATA